MAPDALLLDVVVHHVHPLNDVCEHDLGPSADCVCGPRVEWLHDLAAVVVHNSLDGREAR